MYFLKNPKARYALVGAIATIIASLAEMKRRSDNRDEIKRKIPHRRNSAVHLYDGKLKLQL
jgi:plasmid stabilization system protein ParE